MFLILFIINLLTVHSASQDIKTSISKNEADKKEQKLLTIDSYVSDIQECIKEAQQGIINIEFVKKIFDTTKNHYKAFYEIKDENIKRAEIKKMYDIFLPLYEIMKEKQKYEQPVLEEYVHDLECALGKMLFSQNISGNAHTRVIKAFYDFDYFYDIERIFESKKPILIKEYHGKIKK